MMSTRTIVVILLVSLCPSMVSAVTYGRGSFVCYPCGRENCFLGNPSARVNIGGSVGSITCAAIQSGTDAGTFNPQECSNIQQVVMGSSNPCGCKKDGTNSRCEPPGFTNTQQCNLCSGNMRIGDPDRVIQDGGILDGSTCIEAFDANSGGAFAVSSSICTAAKNSVRSYCKCTSGNSPVTQCIPEPQGSQAPWPCNPADSSQTCCAGGCKYLNSYGQFLCTTRPGNTPPSGSFAPRPNFVVCFSGEMSVYTENKGEVFMKDLVIGDKVLAANNKYETIYSFGHKHATMEASYLQIKTSHSDKPLEISQDHMVFISQNHAVPASMLKEGDSLLLLKNDLVTIESITTVTRNGAFAPFTASGTIVVNDIVASTYISIQDKSEVVVIGGVRTPVTYQWIAHVFEAPHRLAFNLGFASDGANESGVSQWDPPHMAKRLTEQSAVVMTLILAPLLTVFTAIWVFEQYPFLVAALLLLCMIAVSISRKCRSSQTVSLNYSVV